MLLDWKTIITESSMNIVFLAFNFGISSRFVNGPGMSLWNLVKAIKAFDPECEVDVFTTMPSTTQEDGVGTHLISDTRKLKAKINNANLVHHWSGLRPEFTKALSIANGAKKTVFIGPNVVDCVDMRGEKRLLSQVKFDRLLAVNDRLKFIISVKHNVRLQNMDTLVVGPDLELWSPPKDRSSFILWKGNSGHGVKDIDFGLKVADKLDKYEFRFIGHPRAYNYFSHIREAKRAKVYYCTSLSETKGMALAEQWSAGVPSVTHPKIYLHGKNYETGIITNRDVDSYCEAIEEIMENDDLYNHLSLGASNFAKEEFDPMKLASDYAGIVNDVG